MQRTQRSEHSLAHTAASQQLQRFPVGSVLGLDLLAEPPSSDCSVNINAYVWIMLSIIMLSIKPSSRHWKYGLLPLSLYLYWFLGILISFKVLCDQTHLWSPSPPVLHMWRWVFKFNSLSSRTVLTSLPSFPLPWPASKLCILNVGFFSHRLISFLLWGNVPL